LYLITHLQVYRSITQCFFPNLIIEEDKYLYNINEFFKRIQPHLSFLPKYVIDFAILDEKVLVLELNPFHPSTSSCLFDWVIDADRLEKGPFEFRIRKTPPHITRKDILNSWVQWLEQNNVII